MSGTPSQYKMNEIVNNFLLAGDKSMSEMHLKQPGFTYCVCGPFTKNKEIIQKFKETGDTKYIYRVSELDKLNELNALSELNEFDGLVFHMI